MKSTILIVDDNAKWRASLALNFTRHGYAVCHAANRREALHTLSTRMIDVILLDIMLGGEHGVDVLKELSVLRHDVPVVMITGFGSIDTAVDSLKLGAFDYITKPVDFEKLLGVIEQALRPSTGSGPTQTIRPQPEAASRVVTQNAAMLALCERAARFAATDLPILIMGENGTGKEVIADMIHAHSPRRCRPMLKINCASFPENLLDNELFGHEKGAYTGAESAFKGVFERAHGSSLFLDEVGDMPLTIQAKILRTLQSHEIRRLGGRSTIKVDVRFLAATNKDLVHLIERRAFREDLYYRLNVAIMRVPPLRERKDDLPLLAEHFLAEYARSHATAARAFSPAVLKRFRRHAWSGNVRELRNVVNYAATIAAGPNIDLDDLPPQLRELAPPPAGAGHGRERNVRERMERNLIVEMLEQADYNKKRAAELLHISRKTLYSKLAKYGITRQR